MLMLAPNRQVVLVANSFGEGIVPLVLAHMSRTCRSLSYNRVVSATHTSQAMNQVEHSQEGSTSRRASSARSTMPPRGSCSRPGPNSPLSKSGRWRYSEHDQAGSASPFRCGSQEDVRQDGRRRRCQVCGASCRLRLREAPRHRPSAGCTPR
jgi:hypothetical protein